MNNRLKIGPAGQKILLLLAGGLVLGLSGRPDRYFRTLRAMRKEWQEINRRSFHTTIKRLYRAKMVDCRKHGDGMLMLVITKAGKQQLLMYNIKTMTLQKPKRWDGLWRLVIFDIPEHKKPARDALARMLKRLEFAPLQKSVFIHPYPCQGEIDFLTELFRIKSNVHLLTVKETGVDKELRRRFRLP